MKIKSLTSVDTDFLDTCEGLVMLPSVEEKMKELFEEIEVLFSESKKYTWVIVPALIAQTYFAFFTDQNLLWLLTFMFGAIMMFFQWRCVSRAKERMRFIDGIMFVTIETSKDFAQFKKDVEGKITPDIKMAIKKLRD